MPRRTKERIQDILDAVSRIQTFTSGLSFADFQKDERRHGYFAISVSTVWETVTSDLPPLVAQLTGLLGELTE